MHQWLLHTSLAVWLAALISGPLQQSPTPSPPTSPIATPACATIQFGYFQIQVRDATITVEWQTSCEPYQQSVYHLMRANVDPAQGGSLSEVASFQSEGPNNGGYYTYDDLNLPNGQYWYQLDVTDASGAVHYVSGQVPDPPYVILGSDTPAPTDTATATPTSSYTPTASATPTQMPVTDPSLTPAQGTATPLPSATAVIAATPVPSRMPTPQPTLISPLPLTPKPTGPAPPSTRQTPTLRPRKTVTPTPVRAARVTSAGTTATEAGGPPNRTLGWVLVGLSVIGLVGLGALGYVTWRAWRT